MQSGDLRAVFIGAVRAAAVAGMAQLGLRIAHAGQEARERIHQQVHRVDAAVQRHDARRRPGRQHAAHLAVGDMFGIEREDARLDLRIQRPSGRAPRTAAARQRLGRWQQSVEDTLAQPARPETRASASASAGVAVRQFTTPAPATFVRCGSAPARPAPELPRASTPWCERRCPRSAAHARRSLQRPEGTTVRWARRAGSRVQRVASRPARAQIGLMFSDVMPAQTAKCLG